VSERMKVRFECRDPHFFSSCPALCRASTPFFFRFKDVDGRDEPGHDESMQFDAIRKKP